MQGFLLCFRACTSSNPAPPEEMHLRRIPHLAETFDVVPGLSDHTLGTEVPVAGVSLGARIVEKHLTLSRDEEGPDSDFSLEPDEFAEMVQAFRKTEKALGEVRYETTENALCYVSKVCVSLPKRQNGAPLSSQT